MVPFLCLPLPLPPPLPSKAGRKKGHGKKGWRINIIRVVFAAASLENRKGGGGQKKDLPSVRQKSHSPTGLLSSLYVCNLGLQEVGGQKIKMRPTGRIWGTVVVGRTNKAFLLLHPQHVYIHGGVPPPLPFPSLTYISYKKYHEEASSPLALYYY